MQTLINRASPPPATLDPAWLPTETDWPELEELRAEHVRLRAAGRAAASARRALEERFEAEDNMRQAALRASLAGDKSKPPQTTPREERERLLNEASELTRAATGASLDHIDHVLAVVAERGEEWIGDLDGAERRFEEEIRQAEAALAALRTKQGQPARLRHWIDRTRNAALDGGVANLIAYTTIATAPPASTDPAVHQRQIEALMRADFDRTRPRINPERAAQVLAAIEEGDQS